MNKKLLNKASDTFFRLASYWNKPPKGYYVSYKEFVNLSLGFGIISFISVMVTMATVDVSRDMMYFFGVSSGQVWIFGIISALFGIIRAPILSMILDNSKFKSGKFKPFILPATLLTIIFFVPIPFIPTAWNDIALFTFTVPAMNFLGIFEATKVTMTLSITIVMFCVLMGTTFLTLLTQALNGIEQTITPVSQERSNIAAFRGLICNIPSSVVNMLPSILLMFGAFKMINITPNTAIYPLEMNKIIFPIVAILSLTLVIFVVKGTNERVVMSSAHKAKVNLWDGVKRLSTNKYFWIVTAFTIFNGMIGLSNVVDWVRQFCFPGESSLAGFVDFYKTTLLMNALIIGMVTGPLFIKKFGKRKVMITACLGIVAGTGIQLIFFNNSAAILICAFIQNVFIGFNFISATMTSDALDYEQYRSHKRLEGFWQNYSSLVVTIIGVFTAALGPLILQWGGIAFGAEVRDMMIVEETRNNVFFYRALVGFIASCCAILPMVFYDLTEQKHASLVKALRIRVSVENYNAGILTNLDIIRLKEIIDESHKYNDKFILAELEDYDMLDEIVSQYDEAVIREEKAIAEEKEAEFGRNVELESKKLDSQIKKAKEKAIKNGSAFDEEQFTKNFIYKSKHLIKLEENASILAQKEADTAERKAKELANGCNKEIEKLANAKLKASKKSDFDEKAFEKNFIYNSYYLIQLPENAEIKSEYETNKANKQAEKERKIEERKMKEIAKSNKNLLKLREKVHKKFDKLDKKANN